MPVKVEQINEYLFSDTVGLTFLKELGTRIRTVTKERQSFEFLMQRFSVAIQRGNAACILGTLPSASDLDDIYYL